jgi:hypothetical protein
MLNWHVDVDGSQNVHGAVFKLGKGTTSSYLQKVKLNMRSSTETEL